MLEAGVKQISRMISNGIGLTWPNRPTAAVFQHACCVYVLSHEIDFNALDTSCSPFVTALCFHILHCFANLHSERSADVLTHYVQADRTRENRVSD